MKKLFIFFLFFFFSCQNEYAEFHQNKEIEKQIQTQISDFSLEKIEYLSGITLKNTPDLQLLDELIQKIDNAKSRIYLEMYIFTEKRLLKALVDAKKRGIDVKVILEKNIYKAGNLNKNTFASLEKAGVKVVYSDSKNYTLNHTKMMIIDDEGILSTGNYSYSTFRYNREFFVFIQDQGFVQVMGEIFENDFLGNKINLYHPNLVLSPFSTRIKLMTLLQYAEKNIDMYVHNISDKKVLEILIEKQKKGVQVRIIFPDLKKVSSNQDEIELLKQNNISYTIVDKPEIHAKTLYIDEKYLYIGSINYSTPSFDQNREIGILIKNQNILKLFHTIFGDDFKK